MALVLGLWSIVLEPGKTHSQSTTPGIQITNISFGPEITGTDRAVVSIKYPEFEQDDEDEDESEEEDDEDEEGDIKLPKLITKEAVIAILRPEHTEQVSVNISLVEDVEVVEFSVSGPNAVHLVGHYVRQEDFDQDPYSDSEEGYDSNDESIDSAEAMEGMSGMLGEDDDEDDEDEDDEIAAERFEEIKEELLALKKDTNASNALLPTSTSLPTIASPHTLASLPALASTFPPRAPWSCPHTAFHEHSSVSTTLASASDLSPPSLPSTDNDNSKSKKRPASQDDDDVAAALLNTKATGAADGDESMSSTLSKNQKKKLAKKLKSADGSAVPAPATEEKKAKKEEEAPVAKKAAAPAPQTLPGGLVILDSKKGDGPVAKNGKKVGMRYIGKLDNGKTFDSNTKGAPLVFTLGRGEVIKGWDMGVAGMAVGGERKLTIPAALAYGKKGTQGIPGNATLHFDVKLVTLK